MTEQENIQLRSTNVHDLVMISCKFLELIVQILSQLGPSPGMLGESERAEEKLVISN